MQVFREDASGEMVLETIKYGDEYAGPQKERPAPRRGPVLDCIEEDMASNQPKWWMRKCALCSSTSHLMAACPELRAHLKPAPVVYYGPVEVPVYCSNCGKPGHTCSL